jgi:hypothetical protein
MVRSRVSKSRGPCAEAGAERLSVTVAATTLEAKSTRARKEKLEVMGCEESV